MGREQTAGGQLGSPMLSSGYQPVGYGAGPRVWTPATSPMLRPMGQPLAVPSAGTKGGGAPAWQQQVGQLAASPQAPPIHELVGMVARGLGQQPAPTTTVGPSGRK
jgi:hypothetical protein